MQATFRCESGANARVLLVIALILLAPTGSPTPAQSPGGSPVFFEPDMQISGVPSDPAGTNHSETTIAANPKDSRNLVAGYMDLFPTIVGSRPCSFTTTSDGGQSWSVQADLPLRSLPGINACSDPSVTADGRGAFYFAYLDENFSFTTGIDDVDIRVARSIDRGRSFRTSVIAVDGGPSDFVDKPYAVADGFSKSRFQGTVYVSYTNSTFARGDEMDVVVSRDGGGTWSAPVVLDTRTADQILLGGSVPVVAPDGAAYVFWNRFAYYSPPMSIRFSRSTDGGLTWSPAADVASGLPSPGSFYLKNADPDFGFVADRGLIANSFPTAAVATDGTILVAWTDFPNGSCKKSPKTGPIPPCANSDVRMSVSRDRGATWSAPIKVSDEANATDQAFPWMAAHPNGLVSLSWIDRRLDPENINYDVFYTNSFDGARFLPNVRVSTSSSILGLKQFIGDYNGIAGTGDAVFPVWGDLRSRTDVQAFTARGTLAP